MTMVKCGACYRRALSGDKYCMHHRQALDSVTNHYKTWVNAYGGISWEEFLTKLSKMQETGSWVKEVIGAESKR